MGLAEIMVVVVVRNARARRKGEGPVRLANLRLLWAIPWLLVAGYAQAQVPPASPEPLASPVNPPLVISEDHGLVGDCDKLAGCEKEKPEDPPDLTLWNFFTAGWDEEFTRRSSEGRAPDLALLRVQTNFMERELRINYFYEPNIRNKTQAELNNVDYFIAYAFNRRFMLEVLGNEQWIDGRGKNPDLYGAAPRFVGRVQLISTADTSITFNFQVISPNPSLGVHTTTFGYGFAGFEDLTHTLGLYRVGLYYSALFDSFDGPHAKGARKNDVQYDVTIAKTFTDPDTPLIGNFTLFLENFATTDLDGDNSGHTVATLTPGVRFNLGKVHGIKLGIDNWLMFGAEIPVSGPKPWDAIYRFTYIKNF
jgi:hypothetical protein